MQRCSSGWFPHMNEAQDERCGPSVHFLGHLVVITNGYFAGSCQAGQVAQPSHVREVTTPRTVVHRPEHCNN